MSFSLSIRRTLYRSPSPSRMGVRPSLIAAPSTFLPDPGPVSHQVRASVLRANLGEGRVALDKSEGVVKTEISWAVREHRLLCQRRLRTKTLEISPESLCGGIVPPTIDST